VDLHKVIVPKSQKDPIMQLCINSYQTFTYGVLYMWDWTKLFTTSYHEQNTNLFTNLLQDEARVALASYIHWEGIFSCSRRKFSLSRYSWLSDNSTWRPNMSRTAPFRL